MKKFSEFFTESILEKEKTKQEVDSIINEGIVDGFKKLASAGKEKLSKFKDAFADKAKELLSKTLGTLVKSLVSSIQSKDKKPADIKSQMESNPLFKDFLSETNAIEEIQSDFSKEDVEDVVKKEDNVTKESIEEYYKQNNIITEDFGDMADTITTKIFSSVYKIIAGALGAIGWVIKPSFRNWFDKLVRKVQKLFYRSKLGQSIRDLPPEVEQSVMEKFQAIIGIVVVVVMVWIIVSHIKGEGDSISGDDPDGKSFSGKGATADTNEWSSGDASAEPDRFAPPERVSGDALDDERYTKGFIAYKNARRAAFLKEHPGMTKDMYHDMYAKAVQSEFNRAWNQGHLLKIEGDKINSEDLNLSGAGAAASDTADNADTAAAGNANTTDNSSNSSNTDAAADISNNGEEIGDATTSNARNGWHIMKKGKYPVSDGSTSQQEADYINQRVEEITQRRGGKLDDFWRRRYTKMARKEWDAAESNGKILSIKNHKILAHDMTNDDKKKIFGIYKGASKVKTAAADAAHTAQSEADKLDALYASHGNIDFTEANTDIDKYNLNQIIESGAKSITMQSGDTPIKINIENLPDADKKLNPSELLDKYLSSYL